MPGAAPSPLDPVALTAELVRCASVTPAEAGALGVLERALEPLGFRCVRVPRGEVDNLFAIRGEPGKVGPFFGFAGHTDVVPTGEASAWRFDPFSATLADGQLWGRGAVDMKSGVAAFAAALSRWIGSGEAEDGAAGAVALLITGDEEGDAVDGTRALLDWMAEQGLKLDMAVVGEPTSAKRVGDVIKIGRRGSMTAYLTARGRQGHTAYAAQALNPLPALVRFLDRVASAELDQGAAHFEPSTLQLTTVDVGNPANNVIPAEAKATLNIRFNDQHRSEHLIAWLEQEAEMAQAAFGVEIDMRVKVSGESFLTAPGALSELAAEAIAAECGARPEMTTGGGTSDARFIKDMCPVVELGLVGRTMHQTDERVPVEDIEKLTRIYHELLRRVFEG